MLAFVAANTVALPIVGVVEGFSPSHAVLEGSAIAVLGAVAGLAASRKLQATFVSLALLTSAALLVHSTGGLIEAHFYFFVLIVALTLYEDWVPFLAAIGYVLVHHGLGGVIDPDAVYAHSAGQDDPWKWAGIHALFVTGAAVAAVLTWRLNEEVRHRLRDVVASSADAIIEHDTEGRVTGWNPAAARMVGYTAEEIRGQPFSVLLRDDDCRAEVGRLLARVRRGEHIADYELRMQDAQGERVETAVTLSPVRHITGRIVGASWSAREISGRKRAEQQRRAQHAVAAVLAESATVAEAGPRLVEALGESLGAQAGAFWSPDGERAGAELRCMGLWHAPGLDPREYEALTTRTTLASGAGLPGRVYESGRAAWTEGVVKDPRYSRADATATVGLHAAVRIPILNGPEVLGVIELLGEEWRPDRGLLENLIAIAPQIGHFIERKRAETEAQRLKDEFFALVSHELRTPLTSIAGYLELLLEEDEEEEISPPQRRFLEVIDRSARRLQRLVGDLLFVAQLEAGKFTLEPGEADLAAVAAESVEAAKLRAEERDIELVFAAEPVPTLRGDRDRLGQTLDNLVSNALKFTPEGGRVEVSLSCADGQALVEVSDTGIGIPADEQERLFERFVRASTATDVPGIGLGLTIAKAIVDAHGGCIAVASEEGVGTTFRVELPLGPALSDGSDRREVALA